MTAEQHLAEAEKYVQHTRSAVDAHHWDKAGALAALATAHATIAQAKQEAKR